MRLVIDPNAPRNHHLKCWPHFYRQICSGIKRFEIRKDDRDFRVGDLLALEEYEPETAKYTGCGMSAVIHYILRGEEAEKFGVQRGYCVMSIAKQYEYLGAGSHHEGTKPK